MGKVIARLLGQKTEDKKPPTKKLSKWEQAVKNCQTCGHGPSNWRTNQDGSFECRVCDGNPLVSGDGRKDWRDWYRAVFVAFNGPTIDGDLELLDKYREELDERGYL